MPALDFDPATVQLTKLVAGVTDDAPLLDRTLGLTGRDPSWSPG
jgi:hypothetical protein